MKQPPIMTRPFLFSGIYLAWWITLLSFVLTGAYRSFVRPSFALFLWGALAILLVFVIAGLGELGGRRLRFADMVRGGIILLPMAALWMAYGKPLGTYAYLKKAVTAAATAANMPSVAPPGNSTGAKPPAQAELRRNNEPAPLHVSILDLIKQPQKYQGTWITTEGMALRQETFSQDEGFKSEVHPPDSFILFRFLIVCCVADSQPLGVMVTYAKADSVMDNDWYRISGRFSLDKDKMGVISHAEVSNLETPPDPPYLYETMNVQPSLPK